MASFGFLRSRLPVLLLVASAAALWPVPSVDAQVELSHHPDPLATFTADGRPATPAIAGSGGPGERATARALAQTCATVSRPTDDSANAVHPSSSRVLKVIYAYPTNIGNRLATYAPVIQTGVRWVAELAAGESGNTRSLRFDLGTSAGEGCVDIQVIPLSGPSSTYTAVPSQTFSLLRSELLPHVAGQPGSRNFLVYADGINVPGVGGEAQIRSDDSVSGSSHALGALWAMLYGRGGTDFFGSQTGFAAGTTSRSHVDLALHEVSHTLGAVQSSAPHRSAAFHCRDEYDILCYDDDGLGGFSTFVACNTPSNQYWDCNKDDYFNPAPAAGSYLATHWNVYNSVFMCPVDQCAPGGIQGPPNFGSAAVSAVSPVSDDSPPNTTIGLRPRKKARRRAATFQFSSTEPRSTYECRYDRKRYRACGSPFTLRKLRPGRHVFRVYAIDQSGNEDPTPARASFKVLPRRRKK